jgi:hypothetical protein
MSVLLKTKNEINSMIKELATNETEQRAIWYGYIANVTAFNVQYQENIQIDFKDETEAQFDNQNDKDEFLAGSIGSLLYNVYTNAGNCFLADKWVKELENLKTKTKEVTDYGQLKAQVGSY